MPKPPTATRAARTSGSDPRRLVAVGVIARRTRGRSLHLVATQAGVVGRLGSKSATH